MSEVTAIPLISIAMPAYARPALVCEAIQSCLKQDFQDFEILVGDSSKTEDIERFITAFNSPKIVYIRYPHDAKISNKLNDLLARGRGKWMVVLGDDDTFEPGYLSAMVKIVTEHPEASLVRTRYSLMDSKGNFFKLTPDGPARLEVPDFLNVIFLPWYKHMVNITGVFFPREKLRQLGGFLDTRYAWNTDTVAWAWLGTQGTSYFESTPLIRLRVNTDSDYKTKKLDCQEYLEIKRQFFKSITDLFSGLPKSLDPVYGEKVDKAYGLFVKYWMQEEPRHYLDDNFQNYLGQSKAWVRKDVAAMMRVLKYSGLPTHSARFYYFEAISFLPAPFRNILLWTFNLFRRLHHRFFPPERWTFFWKEKP